VLFASFDFLLFFTVVFGGYWALVRRPAWRATWIVGASYFFYMAGQKPADGPPPTPWYFAGLLLLSTLVDYGCGLAIARARDRAGLDGAPASDAEHGEGAARAGRAWLLVSLVTNLGFLGYFKYTGFLFDVVDETAALFGFQAGLPALKILLPVGISFYTFQSLSYTIDVYRGRLPVERSFRRFAYFVAFFPQLVAGPIVRASEFLPQLGGRPRLGREDVDFALWRITKGLVKKILFGDFIASSFTDLVFASPREYGSLENLLALYAFTLQIYADFSGYSDVAIGVARLLGFRIPENFDRPYAAVDVADFWRRWHMTLSTWLRDYVYYPLGGSRTGGARTYVNLWITMFLVGIWHGASWNFVVYANLQAAAMLFNRLVRNLRGPFLARLSRVGAAAGVVGAATWLLASAALRLDHPWGLGVAAGALATFIGLLPSVNRRPSLRPLHVLLTVHFSVLSRVFFRADNLDSASAMAKQLVHWDGLGVRHGLFRIHSLAAWLGSERGLRWLEPFAEYGVLLLVIAGFAAHYTPQPRVDAAARKLFARAPAVLVGAGIAVLLGGLSLLLAGPRANIYFNF
jgi:D-alanyl-lipoteichoic acid acyltransferase DltB (MBOAT superfamily)